MQCFDSELSIEGVADDEPASADRDCLCQIALRKQQPIRGEPFLITSLELLPDLSYLFPRKSSPIAPSVLSDHVVEDLQSLLEPLMGKEVPGRLSQEEVAPP